MKIITRYVLKEHIGPFVFALSALTSLLLLQYIARRFGDLVGRGLSWQIITEFFLLSIPFTLAMTLPMSVLVAVLFAFTRLASENEITAFKAGGISARALMWPAIVAATMLAGFMVYFNDQLLPRANHELATLQMAILRTKPTFALKPQVINTVKESQLYLSAGYIDQESGLMKDVTIHDVSNAVQRRTIYADSGTLSFAQNRKDLLMRLYHGLMLTSPNDNPTQLTRVYYREDVLKVPDVANDFNPINADTSLKGDREMPVCELQRGYEAAHASVQRALNDSVRAMWNFRQQRGSKEPQPKDAKAKPAGGIGALYCAFIDRYLKVKKAEAAEVPRQELARPDQGKKALSKERADSIELANSPEMNDVKARLEDTRHRRNRYGIETQKKFSLAASCIVFVIVGAPLALRFPRGGVGLVIGASFFIFAVYYVGLIGGESLANKNLISPIWAMWIDNIIFTLVGLILILRMGHEGVTSRGGSFTERIDATREWFARQGRRVRVSRPLEAGRN